MKNASIAIDAATATISGWAFNGGSLTERGPLGGVYTYFYATVNVSTLAGWGVWNDTKMQHAGTEATGKTVGGYLRLPDTVSGAELHIAISFISVAQVHITESTGNGVNLFSCGFMVSYPNK